MKTRLQAYVVSRFVAAVLALTLVLGSSAEVFAQKGRGGHAAPHVSMPRMSVPHMQMPRYHAPRMPHPTQHARNVRPPSMPRTARAQTPKPGTANRGVAARNMVSGAKSTAQAARNSMTAAAAANRARAARSSNTVRAQGLTSVGAAGTPRAYTSGARYYPRTYRTRSYGYRGYSRARHMYSSASQGIARTVVYRLRQVYNGLARLDHDYQGHRVRAMRDIGMAMRQLGHRSMGYSSMYGSYNNNSRMGMNGNRTNGMRNRNGAVARRTNTMKMPQAMSDSRMQQGLMTLQGVDMYLMQHGMTSGHARARGYIHLAMQEINTALTIR